MLAAIIALLRAPKNLKYQHDVDSSLLILAAYPHSNVFDKITAFLAAIKPL